MSEELTHIERPKPQGVNGDEMRRFVLETPYGPNPNEAGVDTKFALETLHDFRDTYEDIKKIDPTLQEAIVGATVFGSLVKGRGREGSDIDTYVFVDPDIAGSEPIYGKPDMLSPFIDQYSPTMKRISTEFGRRLPDHGEGLKFVAMNSDIVDAFLTHDVSTLAKGGHGTYDENVITLFHMRTGSGSVQEYRRKVIEGLRHTPSGAQVWQKMMLHLESFEEGRRDAVTYLPMDIEDAESYFMIKSDGNSTPSELGGAALHGVVELPLSTDEIITPEEARFVADAGRQSRARVNELMHAADKASPAELGRLMNKARYHTTIAEAQERRARNGWKDAALIAEELAVPEQLRDESLRLDFETARMLAEETKTYYGRLAERRAVARLAIRVIKGEEDHTALSVGEFMGGNPGDIGRRTIGNNGEDQYRVEQVEKRFLAERDQNEAA